MTVQEFNRCVDAYADSLYHFIVKNIKDRDESKDFVQDAFENLWKNNSRVVPEKAKSYLFTIAYRDILDRIRRRKKNFDIHEMEFSGNYTSVTHRENYSDAKEVMEKAVHQLSDVQRTLIMLRDYEGYSYEEIAEITKMNLPQVKVYIHRARVFLKQKLGSIERVL